MSGPDHAPDIDKLELLPIIRIYSESESALDLRSRLLAKGKLGSAELRAFVLSAMRLPSEFEVDHVLTDYGLDRIYRMNPVILINPEILSNKS